VVDRDREVRESRPRVAGGIVGVDATRVAAAREEAAGDDDPGSENRGRDLGTRLRERRPADPGGRRDRGGDR
jgi:hypothetical protein